jgi:pseudouridylate synthase
MVVAPHVREALDKGRPVVALESTIISHGMPYPRNLEVAKLVEDTVRAAGCVPATIAVINGVPKIGISDAEMNMLAVPRDVNNSADMIWKASRRDLGYICAMKYSASTTVASTMILAHAASIPVFATGGIGGAHYDAQQTMDISADLMELGKTPVAVVSAGIKSILDLKLTMEVLETQGVPVVSGLTRSNVLFMALLMPNCA